MVHLKAWAKQQGIHPQTAYRWFHQGTLPVPAVKMSRSTILVLSDPDSAAKPATGVGLYARVSSHDQQADLDRQMSRLALWAAQTGVHVVRAETEIGSGVNGTRTKIRRLLADPAVTTIVVEHRDRLGRMNTEMVEAALAAHHRRLVVLDPGEIADDLVRDMTEVLTSFCARLYGQRSARSRALKALECAQSNQTTTATAKPGV